jgi:hypothetical protein
MRQLISSWHQSPPGKARQLLNSYYNSLNTVEITWKSHGDRVEKHAAAALNCKYAFPHFLAALFGALIRLARAGAPV